MWRTVFNVLGNPLLWHGVSVLGAVVRDVLSSTRGPSKLPGPPEVG